MPTISLTRELYFTTTTVVDWMDVFTRPQYKHIIIDSLKYCQANKGLDIYAWVLMTNHLHMIIGMRDDYQVGSFLRDFKKFTAKSIIKAIRENEQESRDWLIKRFEYRSAINNRVTDCKFWQDDNHLENIFTYDFYKQKLNYIHQNPVRQAIVDRPEDYLYSSARNYAGLDGLLEVIVEQ